MGGDCQFVGDWGSNMDKILGFCRVSEGALRRTAVFWLAIVGISGVHIVLAQNLSDTPPVLSSEGLRGVYFGTGKKDSATDRVGRLAIELAEGTEQKTVRVDHPFHTGDKFRFKVSSNRDGWLYIFHRAAKEGLSLLWPRMAGDSDDDYMDMNRVKAGRTYTVPSSPGLFVFDDQVGDEYFYVVVAAERKMPQLAAMDPARSEVTAAKEKDGRSRRIVNFGIRSGTTPTADTLRGVIYDPGRKDDDPYLYFATQSDDGKQPAFVEFHLRHQ